MTTITQWPASAPNATVTTPVRSAMRPILAAIWRAAVGIAHQFGISRAQQRLRELEQALAELRGDAVDARERDAAERPTSSTRTWREAISMAPERPVPQTNRQASFSARGSASG
jgi:hypothetical protein